MDIKDLKALIRTGESFPDGLRRPYMFLGTVAKSKNFTVDDWKAWLRAGNDAVENRLGHLEMVLSRALAAAPDRHPVLDPAKRAQRADKIRKQVEALADSVRALERDEGMTWGHVISRFREGPCGEIAAKYPAEQWRRSIPPLVHLGEGWQRGVGASIESMPIILGTFEQAIEAWKVASTWQVRTNQGEKSARTYFVKLVRLSFEERYGRPLNKVVASLSNVFFQDLGQLTEQVVSQITTKPRS